MQEWWTRGETTPEAPRRPKAVAYYRHSAQDRQENSIPIQREQVCEWADKVGIEIVEEFADHGKSGLSAEHRDAFNDMLENWVKVPNDIEYVLVLDVSRWGRFQDIDMSATYSAECTKHGKRVVYTSLGLPDKDDPLHSVFVGFERFRAAQYSRELSQKVFNGCAKISEQGYRAGGPPPYGLDRLLLDEARQPVQILEPGERKSIQNQRVTLTPKDDVQADVVVRIFKEFVEKGYDECRIADRLNRDGIPSPGGVKWDSAKLRHVLNNESYIGTMVYNKTTQRLMSPKRPNPPEEWIRKEGAFPGVIPRDLYEAAQAVFAERKRRATKEYLLETLRNVYDTHGCVSPALIRSQPDAPSPYAYSREFRCLAAAFQNLFDEALRLVVKTVRIKLLDTAEEIQEYSDFVVINQSFTILIQPSMPVPYGFKSYWPFFPDKRPVVDITLGVPLSGEDDCNILGYLALPRLLVKESSIRLFSASNSRVDLFGHNGLDFVRQLITQEASNGKTS